MPDAEPRPVSLLALTSLLALAACAGQPQNNLAALDNELMGNGQDPALTSALEDQILVDPNLVGQSQPNSARPAEAPMQAQYPEGPDPTRPGATRRRRARPAGLGDQRRRRRASRAAARITNMARNGRAGCRPNSRLIPAAG